LHHLAFNSFYQEPRVKAKYFQNLRSLLQERFNYENLIQDKSAIVTPTDAINAETMAFMDTVMEQTEGREHLIIGPKEPQHDSEAEDEEEAEDDSQALPGNDSALYG